MPSTASSNNFSSIQDYYSYGMLEPLRSFSNENYRFGFNGKENDNESVGTGDYENYGMRIYDSRVGRFISIDPLFNKFPWWSPYAFAGDNPIWAKDLDGLETDKVNDKLSYTPTPVLTNSEQVKLFQERQIAHAIGAGLADIVYEDRTSSERSGATTILESRTSVSIGKDNTVKVVIDLRSRYQIKKGGGAIYEVSFEAGKEGLPEITEYLAKRGLKALQISGETADIIAKTLKYVAVGGNKIADSAHNDTEGFTSENDVLGRTAFYIDELKGKHTLLTQNVVASDKTKVSK